MTVVDLPRWTAGLRRLLAGYDWVMPVAQAEAWFDQLERYPIDAIEQALREAPAESGRFKPSVGLLEQLVKKQLGSTPPTTGDWHAPEIIRDTDGQVLASWRCVLCEDHGWRAVLTSTGQVLTHDELMRWRSPGPREDGRPHYGMRRCACSAVAVQREVA